MKMTCKHALLLCALPVATHACTRAPADDASVLSSREQGLIAPIEPLTIASGATAFGLSTFQSHNQKVVRNQHGTFVSYALHEGPPVYSDLGQVTWQIAADSGSGFVQGFEQTDVTRPPIIETSASGTLFVLYSDLPSERAHLLRFAHSDLQQSPDWSRELEYGGSGKMAMLYDDASDTLYYSAGYTGQFFRVRRASSQTPEVIRTRVTGPGQIAWTAHYTHLYLDREGKLYLAWTSYDENRGRYWSLHFIVSDDRGETWRTAAGTQLTLPVPADHTGPADMIAISTDQTPDVFLSSMTVKEGRAHFMYGAWAADGLSVQQRYVRYDLHSQERTDVPLAGSSLNLRSESGFFATDRERENGMIYAVGASSDDRLAALVSYDNGGSWADLAVGPSSTRETPSEAAMRGIGGARELDEQGKALTAYTLNRARVMFAELQSQARPPLGQIGDLDGDGKADLLRHDLTGETWVARSDGQGRLLDGSRWRKDGEKWCPGAYQFGRGDFNGDGRDDQLCHDNNGNTWVALSSGQGSFTHGGRWMKDGEPWCPMPLAAIGDFNGDGRDDLACHDDAGNTWIALSNGSNGFTHGARWTKDGTTWCPGPLGGSGDFNGDRLADLACHDNAGNTWVALSNGRDGFYDGSLWRTNGEAWCPGYQFGVGDFNADGRADLLCHADSGQTWIALSSGNGSFTGGHVWAADHPAWCKHALSGIGDFDGDGDADLLCYEGNGEHRIALTEAAVERFSGGSTWPLAGPVWNGGRLEPAW